MKIKQDTLIIKQKPIQIIFPDVGYPLKKYTLKKWIYGNGYTQPYIARKMNLLPEEFKRKLREREKFNEKQIRSLVKIMDAESAFRVIYFPTKKIRRKVWREVFGKRRDKERLNE